MHAAQALCMTAAGGVHVLAALSSFTCPEQGASVTNAPLIGSGVE